MSQAPRLSCGCGRPDFQAEQASVYARYGWEVGNYFALLDKFTWEDDFHDMMPPGELRRLKAGYYRVGHMLADSLQEAQVRCGLRDRTVERLQSWVTGLGLHFGADTGEWLAYREGRRRTFRLLPLRELRFLDSAPAPASYGHSADPPALRN